MNTIHLSGPPTPAAGSRRPGRFRDARRRQLTALLTTITLALSLTATALTATPARAATEPDHVRLGGWSVSGTVASARLPGNGAALGLVRYSAPGQVLEGSDDGTSTRVFPTASTLTAYAGCITNRQLLNVPYNCRTDTVTITFPRKIANPELGVGLSGGAVGRRSDVDATCVIGWPSATIRAINGAAPAAGDVTLRDIDESTSEAYFSNNMFALAPDAVKAAQCIPPGGGERGRVRLRGLVESVTIEATLYAMLTRNPGGTYSGGIAPVGGIKISVDVPVADLAMQKAGPAIVDSEGAVTWDLAVRNNGPAPSTGFVVKDAVPAEVTGAALVDAPPGCRLQGRDLVCAQAPPGCAATQNLTVPTWADLTCTPRTAADGVVLRAGETSEAITLTGTAPSARGTVVTNTASVSGADVDLAVANNTAAASTTVEAPTLAVRTDVIGRVDPRDQFTVQASGATGPPVASATTSGAATTATSTPVQVQRGASYTISEAMAGGSPTGIDRYRTDLVCVDDTTGASAPAEASASGWTFVPTENHPYTCTVTTTPAPEVTVRVAKVGESAAGDVVRMAGSGFELLADDDGRAGTPLTDAVAVETDTGLFELTDLAPGTYWLRETVAPDGFTLLAAPVRFTVSPEGVVSLTDPETTPQVTADGDLITVHDVPSFGLPEAGGTGPLALTLAGASLLALALALSAGRTRRVRRDTPQESRNNA